MADHRYDPKEIEPRWQKVWEDEQTWHVENGEATDRDKSYVLVMLPYPSGEPHIGHLKVYSVGDAVAHFHRRNGLRVLNPMGYDAFGLPAENHAIKTGQHPRVSTDEAIIEFRKAFHEWGVSIDWSREFGTHEPRYYRWTQWIFLALYERGLAYRKEAAVKWCPNDQTVLANEQVIDGRCERCGWEVEVKQLEQWFFRITDYADRLLDDLDTIEWPEHVKTMQRNWIGRSEGAEVKFRCEELDTDYPVFTTRPDTLFGATFFVLAPEHPDVLRLAAGTPHEREVREYVRRALTESAEERGAEDREKTGVPLGRTVTNPVNAEEIAMFVADYVLAGYGTGAIMAVPGQDERDWEFAEEFGLPIIRTVQPPEGFDGNAYLGDGPAINSGPLNGLHVAEAKKKIIEELERAGWGTATITYKLRDWLFSRQRYWGEPFPIVYDETGLPVALPESMLPVELPEMSDFQPRIVADDEETLPEPPLARAEQWVTVEADLGEGTKTYLRETNTMPQWAGSCWYYLRYIDPHNDNRFVDPVKEAYWMPVDLYIGGVEHAVLHLLYARFWHKVLYDLGHISSFEPFRRLFNQGYIQAYAYTDERGSYVPAEEVSEVDGGRYVWNGRPVRRQYGKMGKSLKNVVTPDEMCAQYGADTFRVYEMSMGPLEVSRPWETRAVVGAQRFLQRVWRAVVDEQTGAVRVVDTPADEQTRRLLHRVIDGVRGDMEGIRFNTAIAKLIELTNRVTVVGGSGTPREVAEPLVLMVAPFAPHIAEELWRRLGHEDSLAYADFPVADPALLVTESVTYPVQVNGKVRGRVQVAADAAEDAVRAAALAAVADHVTGEPRKVIVVPGRMVSVVV